MVVWLLELFYRTWAFAPEISDEWLPSVAGRTLVWWKGLASHVLVAELLNSEVLIRSYFYWPSTSLYSPLVPSWVFFHRESFTPLNSGFPSGACSGQPITNTCVLMCSFLCVWCISGSELLMFKSSFFSLHEVKKQISFFPPSSFSSICKSNVKKGQYPFAILAAETSHWELYVCKHRVTPPVKQQQHRGADNWFVFSDTLTQRSLSFGYWDFTLCSFQVWAGRLLMLGIRKKSLSCFPDLGFWGKKGFQFCSVQRGYSLFKLCYNSLCGR